MIWIPLFFAALVSSQSWTRDITKNINALRKEYRLPKIVYNYTLHQELINIVDNSWPGIFYKQNGTGIHFPFNKINKNLGYDLHPLGSNLLFHDTILKPDRIKLIIRQRINAKKCLAKVCSGISWVSCFKDQSYENLFANIKSPCVFAHHYLLKLLLKDLKYIACVILRYESGLSPIYQPYSFMCYANSDWFNQTSDLLRINK